MRKGECVWDPNHPSLPILSRKAWGPGPMSSPGLVWPLGGLEHLLPLQLFPSTLGHSLGPRLFPEAPSLLPPRGPLAHGFRPTHFLCEPQLRPHLGWKVSLQDGRLLLLPSQRVRKAQGEWGGALGSQVSAKEGKVPRPPPHNHRPRLDKLGTLRKPAW